jgi:hypothetical protein
MKTDSNILTQKIFKVHDGVYLSVSVHQKIGESLFLFLHFITVAANFQKQCIPLKVYMFPMTSPAIVAMLRNTRNHQRFWKQKINEIVKKYLFSTSRYFFQYNGRHELWAQILTFLTTPICNETIPVAVT